MNPLQLMASLCFQQWANSRSEEKEGGGGGVGSPRGLPGPPEANCSGPAPACSPKCPDGRWEGLGGFVSNSLLGSPHGERAHPACSGTGVMFVPTLF